MKEIFEWIYCIIIAFILAILVKYFIGIPTVVKMSSMYPTLVEEERLILDRTVRTFSKELNRGDIVTFEAPSKKVVLPQNVSADNVKATYENEPDNWWDSFVYYVLEINKEAYIKRVIGLPGEHLVIENGKVYINGKELEESYLAEDVVTDSTPAGVYMDVVIPEGYVFVMGDNRKASTDSRAFGCVPISKIESRVVLRFWPLNKFGTID